MAVTQTFACELNSRTYYGTANRNEGHATHGNYGNENGDWIGMVYLPVDLTGKIVTAVSFSVTANNAGTTAQKTVYFYSSNYQTVNAAGTGSIFPKSQLFYVRAPFRNATIPFNLVEDRLANVANYLSSGGRLLILYDPTSDVDNYCRFTNITITVTYEEPAPVKTGTVKLNVNGRWEECEIHYRINGRYEKCIPHIMQNGMYEECCSS